MAARSAYGGTTLWLLDARDCDAKEPTAAGGSGNCDDLFIQPLPGLSQLTASNAWGGVFVDDINLR